MDYIPVFILLIAGAIIGGLVLVISTLLGSKNPNPRKNTPFECGVPPIGDARHRFSVRFFLVAILFLLFDVEAIFFYPYAVVFRQFLSVNSFILVEMAFFVLVLAVGYIYVLRKGALEWE